ncbi:MAG: AI-2E family transporter [Hyphomicrobiaceae bacterium]|nr:AI-2E family transporter [Hyphomicrobiaceae bacterium]
MPLLADSARQMAAGLTIMALVIAGLVLGQSVLIPLAGAAIVAFMLSPIVRWLGVRRMPRAVSVALVIGAALGVLVAITVVLSAELLSVTARLDDYKQNIVAKARAITALGKDDGVIKRAADAIDRLGIELEKELRPDPSRAPAAVVVRDANDGETGFLPMLGRVVHPIAMAGLTLLFSLFLLLQHQDLRDRIVRILGTDNMSETTGAMTEAGTRLSQLFLAQLSLNVGYGVFAGLVLWSVGVPGALLWGALASLMRFVPFIGSFIASVPPILLAAGVEPGWGLVIFTALFFLVSETATGHLIEPLVLGRSVGLSPLALIAAASFWTLLWGPIGLLLSAPLTIAIVVMGRYLPGLSFLSVLLGDEPALTPEQELYHRLLSNDALASSDEIDVARESRSLAYAMDQVVLPALRLAGADARIGRMTNERATRLRDTLEEALAELLELEPEPEISRGAVRVVLIAGRGEVDLAASRALSLLIRASLRCEVLASQVATGLTALADARHNTVHASPAAVVVVSVGGLPVRQLQLIAQRAARDFPSSRVVTVARADAIGFGPRTNPDGEPALKLSSVVELMAVLLAATRPATADATTTTTDQLNPIAAVNPG